MARQVIVGHFDDYGAAHRAFSELLHDGIDPGEVSLVAGDRSDREGGQRDFGILQERADDYRELVRRGLTLLAVRAEDAELGRIRHLLAQHAPAKIDMAAIDMAAIDTPEPQAARWVTMSGAPADRAASPGELPKAGPGRSLVEEEGDLAAAVDPDEHR